MRMEESDENDNDDDEEEEEEEEEEGEGRSLLAGKVFDDDGGCARASGGTLHINRDVDRAPTVREEVWTILSLGVPVSFTRLLSRSVPVVSLFFVGRMTDPARLAAASLASSVANVTGYSVMIGYVGGLNTLAGQSYGAKEYYSVGYNLQMAVMLTLVTAIFPVSVVWALSEPILVLLGQEMELARLAARYLQVLIPSLFSYALLQCLMIWLQIQHVVTPLTVASLVVAAINVPTNWILVSEVGYLGGAISSSLIISLNLALSIAYVLHRRIYVKTWKNFSFRHAMRSALPMLKLSLSSLVMLAEWWASEINVLLSGMLSDGDGDGDGTSKNELTLSAMSIFQNVNALAFMIPLGISMAVSVRVSKELGAGHADRARRAARVGVVLTLMTTVIVGLLLVSFRHSVGSAFTRDAELVDFVASLIPFLMLYHVGDGLCSALSGVLSGSGQQSHGAICVVFSYFVVGVPISYAFAFGKLGIPRMGVLGLVLGRLAGKVFSNEKRTIGGMFHVRDLIAIRI